MLAQEEARALRHNYIGAERDRCLQQPRHRPRQLRQQATQHAGTLLDERVWSATNKARRRLGLSQTAAARRQSHRLADLAGHTG